MTNENNGARYKRIKGKIVLQEYEVSPREKELVEMIDLLDRKKGSWVEQVFNIIKHQREEAKSIRQETIKRVMEVIHKQMIEYANTPLDKRRIGYAELYALEEKLRELTIKEEL